MNRYLVAILATAILLLGGIVAYFVVQPADVDEPPATSAATPSHRIDFSLPDLDGNVHRISDWQGKARLVNFWATWCAPCRREIPLLKKTQEEQQANNVQVIGIAVDFLEPVVDYAQEAEFNYPILVGQEEAMAAAEESGVEFIGMPFTMVLAPDGELLKTHTGEIVEAHIETIIGVFERMERGDLDLAGARLALRDL